VLARGSGTSINRFLASLLRLQLTESFFEAVQLFVEELSSGLCGAIVVLAFAGTIRPFALKAGGFHPVATLWKGVSRDTNNSWIWNTPFFDVYRVG